MKDHSKENLHISLIPDLPHSFYRSMEGFFSLHTYCEINLPFHLTLYTFKNALQKDKEKIMDSLPYIHSLLPKERFDAKVGKVNFFKVHNKEAVYFLPITHEALNSVHEKIKNMFGETFIPTYPFFGHVSLFFPQENLSSNEQLWLENEFATLPSIRFKSIVLFSEQNHIFRIVKSISL